MADQPQKEQQAPRGTWKQTQGVVAPKVVQASGKAKHPHWRNDTAQAKRLYGNATTSHAHTAVKPMDAEDLQDGGADEAQEDAAGNKKKSTSSKYQ